MDQRLDITMRAAAGSAHGTLGRRSRETVVMVLHKRTVASGEVTISYRDTGGNQPPVVILHGLAGSGMEFIATAEALPEYRLILVDLRAHGDSTRRPRDLSRAAYVGDVVQVIETAAGGPVALIGQSMGGHTAMLVAAARRDLVIKLVLLETTAGGDGDETAREAMRRYFDSWPVPFADEQAASDFLGEGALERAWVANLEHRADGLSPKFESDAMVETMEAVDEEPRWAKWESVTAPTLVVFAEDGMFDEDTRRKFVARGRQVQRVDIPRSGHDAHLDAPSAWTATLRAFLQ